MFIYQQEIEYSDFQGKHPKEAAMELIDKNGAKLIKAIPATVAGSVFFSTDKKLENLPEWLSECTGKQFKSWENDLSN